MLRESVSQNPFMKGLRKSLLLLAGTVITLLALAAHHYYRAFYPRKPGQSQPVRWSSLSSDEAARLTTKLAGLKQYAVAHGYNTEIGFLVDMQLPSGKNRFFVCDFSRDTILLSGLVAHGRGAGNFSYKPFFSNISGSNCTSLGKYRIGQRYQGRFGTSYKLYGLDTSNSRAFQRNVVLHPFAGVPEGETDPLPICNSQGCPMVSPAFFARLQPLLEKTKAPVLLEIYN